MGVPRLDAQDSLATLHRGASLPPYEHRLVAEDLVQPAGAGVEVIATQASDRVRRSKRGDSPPPTTAAAPLVPSIPGLESADHLTSGTVWGLTELPGRLVVLGGAPVGCERSSAHGHR